MASLLFESPFIGLEKLVFQGAGHNNSSETKPEITSSAQKQTMEDAESVEKTNNDSKTNQLRSQNGNIQENKNTTTTSRDFRKLRSNPKFLLNELKKISCKFQGAA